MSKSQDQQNQNGNRTTPPVLKPELPISMGTGVIFTLLVFLLLPISQLIDSFRDTGLYRVERVDQPPPPPIEEPPPPEEEEVQEDIQDIEQQREPPTLDQIALSITADLSGFASSDFTIPDWNVGGQLSDIIYELEDLTRQPRPVSRRQPVYPPELQRARVEGTVVLRFVVQADGTTSRITVERSDNPAFEEPAIRAVRTWRFEPGEKDGRAVNVWVRQPIPFTIRR